MIGIKDKAPMDAQRAGCGGVAELDFAHAARLDCDDVAEPSAPTVRTLYGFEQLEANRPFEVIQ